MRVSQGTSATGPTSWVGGLGARHVYFGMTRGSPPGVPGGGMVMFGSTFGGLTVESTVESAPGLIMPSRGTAVSERLSGGVVVWGACLGEGGDGV